MKKRRRGSCVLKMWVGAFLLIPIFFIPYVSEYKWLRAMVGARTEVWCGSLLAWQLLWGFGRPVLPSSLPSPKVCGVGLHTMCAPPEPHEIESRPGTLFLLTGAKQAALR